MRASASSNSISERVFYVDSVIALQRFVRLDGMPGRFNERLKGRKTLYQKGGVSLAGRSEVIFHAQMNL